MSLFKSGGSTQYYFVHHYFLCHSCQQSRFAMHQRVQHSHSIYAQHRFTASTCFHLWHPETFQSRWSRINIAGTQQIRHKCARNSIDSINNFLFNAQTLCQFLVRCILNIGALLWPYFTDVFPFRNLVVNNGQCLHHFLTTLRSSIATYGENHQFIRCYTQCFTHGYNLWVILAVRLKRVGIATHRQHFYLITINAIAHIHLFYPIRRNQDKWKRIQHILIVGNISIGHQPGNSQCTKFLWVQHQMRSITPVTYSYHHIRFKPTVIPFFFLIRFEMRCMNINTQFHQPFV